MRFKIFFSLIIAFAIIASAISVNFCIVNAADVKDKIDIGDIGDIKLPDPTDRYQFKLKPDGTYEITGHEGFDDITGIIPDLLSLPSAYNGKPVTSIADRAFARDAYGKFDNIKKVIIPNSITSIGSLAFAGCLKLSDITIPSRVTHFGTQVFDDTPWLKSRETANSLVIINNILIEGKTAKGKITIPDGVTSINDYAFSKNEDITTVIIPDNVKAIGNGAFSKCYNLTSVKLSSNLESIGEWAFENCNLTELTLPSSLKAIEAYSLWGNKFTKINIPYSVEKIGKSAFGCCINLEALNIPDSVQIIGDGAFRECRNLKNVIIPENVTSLGTYTFNYTYKLNSITIKNKNCIIGDDSTTIPYPITIYGYYGSTAESYATKYSNKFIPLNSKVGDANSDGKVNIVDAAYIAKKVAQRKTSELDEFADYNKDGKCNINDAASIAKDVARKILK